jgi:class 3 adenylate cyclase
MGNFKDQKFTNAYNNAVANEGWFFFIDIVGASNPALSIDRQLKKIEKVVESIEKYLSENSNPEIYKSFTGDGMLVVFTHFSYPLELSIDIHKNLDKYNTENLGEDKISVRIGIGSGSYRTFNDRVHTQPAPWGHELVLAQRIMDRARPNQILLTDFAFKKIQNDFFISRNDSFYPYLKEKGRIVPKHHKTHENIYSFYKENEFGNGAKVEHHLDIKPIIMESNVEVNENLERALESFCKRRLESTISKFKKIILPSVGLEVGPTSEDLMYQVLFEHGGENYIAATYLTPSEYWNIQNTNPTNILDHHKELLKRQKDPKNTSHVDNYRFLILDKKKLDDDIKQNQYGLDFIMWHSINGVRLYHKDPSNIKGILNKYPAISFNIGIGLWYGKYMLQFGSIIRYVDKSKPNQPLKKRRFWLHDYDTDIYLQSLEFFEELKMMADSGKMELVDHNYYNHVLAETQSG